MSETVIDSTGPQPCPFCSGTYELVKTTDDYGALHSLPMCASFKRMEADDFAVAARRARGIPDEN